MPVLPCRSPAGLPRYAAGYDGAGGFRWRTWWGGARAGYPFSQRKSPVGWHRLRPTAFSLSLSLSGSGYLPYLGCATAIA